MDGRQVEVADATTDAEGSDEAGAHVKLTGPLLRAASDALHAVLGKECDFVLMIAGESDASGGRETTCISSMNHDRTMSLIEHVTGDCTEETREPLVPRLNA